MRAAVISHAAVIPANQVLYCLIEQMPDVRVALVVPERWDASIGGMTDFTPHHDLDCPVVTRPVRFNGNINMHTYRGLAESALPFVPEIIYADEDPYSLAAHQAYRLSRRLGVPFVFKSNQNLVRKYPPPFCWTERAVYRNAAAAIAIAPACADVLRRKGFQGHIGVVPHSIETDIWRPRPETDLRSSLSIPADAFVIGYIGRLTPEKGVRDLLGAVAKLEGRIAAGENAPRDVVLLMIGDGELRGEIEVWSADLPHAWAHLTGVVPHGEAVADHVNCMDVMVLPSRTTPSWKEQFGRVIIEAMACGVPVIGSDSGHIPVLIEETGGGIAFPEGDAEALAEALHTLCRNPAQASALGQAGHAHVSKRYSAESVARRIADVWRAAMAR